jgi:hypothetical protein
MARQNLRAVCVLTPDARPNSRASPAESTAPRKRNMVAWRRRPIPRVMQCPRQGFVWTDGKGSMHPRRIWRGNLPAETGSCGRRICSRGRGGPPDFPRRRRPRCIAPCGGVVGRGGRPATFLPCRRKPAATGHCAPSPPCRSEPCRICWQNGECRKLRKRCRREGSRLAASIPGALDKAAAAAYGGATARPAGPAAAPAGAPGYGRGSTAL